MLLRSIIPLLVFLGWGAFPCGAAGPVRLDSEVAELSLTPHLTFFRDATGRMTLEEVQQQWQQGQFSLGTDPRPSLGFTGDAIWMRFRMKHHGTVRTQWIVELESPRLDAVDAFLLRSAGPPLHFAAGNLRPPSPRMMDSIRPAFPISLGPGEEAEFMVRAQSETSLLLPLSIRSVRQYARAQAEHAGLGAGYFGYLKALIVLGLLLGVITRERGTVTYALAMVATLASYLIMSGHLAWPGFPARAVVMKQGLIVAGEAALALMIVFLRRLLDLRLTLPRLDRWAVHVIWANVAATLVLLVLPVRIALPLFLTHVLAVGLVLMLGTVFAWHRGIRAARFYALAWAAYWLSYGVSAIQFLARQPLENPVWEYGLRGVVASGTLFLIAIADRVRELRKAAQRAQAELLAAERRNGEQLSLQLRQKQSFIRDLHDGIGGLTANLAILAELGRRHAAAERDREQFARISDLASDGGTEVRSLMRSLEAGEMSWEDVADEIRRHGRTALQPHGIEFSLSVTGRADQPGPGIYAGLSLLRLLKEAFNNSVKHAACTRVSVEAEFTPHRLRLSVRDNGRGLPPQRSIGRGLNNMASRIAEIGGSMSCRSADGVELVFELPLPVTFVPAAAAAAEPTPAGPHPSDPAAPSPGPAARPSALSRLSFGLFE